MTTKDFLHQIPDIIEHPTSGYGELEIIVDNSTQKGVCYRHRNNTASYGTYGKTWLEVYEKLNSFLIKNGHKK